MAMNKEKASGIIVLVIICCVFMALIETIIEPAYIVKSALKVAVFLLLPLVYAKITHTKLLDEFFKIDKRGMMKLFVLGSFIYAVILGAYTLTKNFFDYASLVQSLSADQKVNSGSFIGVALYISICNSFLEEFFFRFVAFIRLSKYTARKIAYIFSSGMFAVYHIAMIGMSFPPLMLLLALIGLAIGGLLFDYVDSKNENIYHSWVIHMFADFAIMTVSLYLNLHLLEFPGKSFIDLPGMPLPTQT